jgi:uncharacterized protein (TIGR00297 family)
MPVFRSQAEEQINLRELKIPAGDNSFMSGAADSVAFSLQDKTARESRLRWQSHVLLALVLLPATAGLIQITASATTPATAEGLAICAAFGLLVWLLRAATPLAAATGFVVTSCLYLRTVEQPSGGWFHTSLLPGLALFVLAFAATRFRRSQKERSGLAESRRGRRASQVAANMGAAALAALALSPPIFYALDLHGWTFSGPTLFAPVIAALAEAAADTVSSEIGQAVGGMPWIITSFRRIQPGTDGAVSVTGTAAGLAAAAIVVLAAVPTLRFDWREASLAWVAAVCGLFADSLIGATLERHGWLNNDAVNFLSTAIAALIAIAFCRF